LLLYGVFVLVGCWPVNRGFTPTPGGVAVYVLSTPVHTDLIVPIENDAFDWSERFPAGDFTGEIDWADHYAIGWGDRGFYLDTPTWDDLKASTALRALAMPSGSVVHVQAHFRPETDPRLVRIDLSEEQYARLCDAMSRALARSPDRSGERIEGEQYHDADAFYEGRGSYSCFYTCNSWAGDCLKEAGVCVPMWSPLPGSPTWYVE